MKPQKHTFLDRRKTTDNKLHNHIFLKMGKNCDHLKAQDASTVDPAKLTALSPEVVRYSHWFSLFIVGRIWRRMVMLAIAPLHGWIT